MPGLKRLTEPTEVERLSPKHISRYLYGLIRELRGNFNYLFELITRELYDDLRFPATGIYPPGAVSDPDWDATNGGWLFDSSSQEVLFLTAQLPHSWREGSDIEPHVHWQKTTSASGDVYWQLEYKWAPIGEVMDSSFTTLFVSDSSITDTDTADKHLISSFGFIDSSGKTISDMLILKLSRLGGNVADTYGADVRLLEFDIHYKKSSLGSSLLYQK